MPLLNRIPSLFRTTLAAGFIAGILLLGTAVPVQAGPASAIPALGHTLPFAPLLAQAKKEEKAEKSYVPNYTILVLLMAFVVSVVCRSSHRNDEIADRPQV